MAKVALVFVAALLLAGQAGAAGHSRPVPILMYHVIAPPPASAPYPELYVRPADFRAQMHWLSVHGFHAVTLGRVHDYWEKGSSLPPHPIVVSFDDGYHSQYQYALPALRALQWPGVLNLLVKNTTPVWGLRPGLVRAMIHAGWEVDSHTIDHLDVTTLDAAQLKHEIGDSRTILRREFHVPVDFFCYPSGRFDAAAIAAVRAAGYLGATTTQFGLANPSNLYTLSRVRVNGSDGVAGLAAKLRSLGAG
jgi:peptidoglycan/xylan/chitin deacetylase (PgdA/CDA1 family)